MLPGSSHRERRGLMNPWEHSLCNLRISVEQSKVPLTHVSLADGGVSFGENQRSFKQELARYDCFDPNWHFVPLVGIYSAFGIYLFALWGRWRPFQIISVVFGFQNPGFCFPEKSGIRLLRLSVRKFG